jgi:hypothetical protein
MIAVVRPFSVELRGGRPDVFFEVLYVQERPDGSVVYCVADPITQQQLLVEADNVTKVLPT